MLQSPNFREQEFLPPLHRDRFSENHQSIRPLALSRTIFHFGDVFVMKLQFEKLPLFDDPILDILPASTRRRFHVVSRRTPESLPVPVLQALGNVDEIRHRVDPEGEEHAFVVPAVQVLRLRDLPSRLLVLPHRWWIFVRIVGPSRTGGECS